MKKRLVLSLIVLLGLLIAGPTWAMSKKPSPADIRVMTIQIADSLVQRAVARSEAMLKKELGAKGDTLNRRIDVVAGRTSAVRGEINLLVPRLVAAESTAGDLQQAVQGNTNQIANLGLTFNQSLAEQKEEIASQQAVANQAQAQKDSAQDQGIEALKVLSAKRSVWTIPWRTVQVAAILVLIIHVSDHK